MSERVNLLGLYNSKRYLRKSAFPLLSGTEDTSTSSGARPNLPPVNTNDSLINTVQGNPGDSEKSERRAQRKTNRESSLRRDRNLERASIRRRYDASMQPTRGRCRPTDYSARVARDGYNACRPRVRNAKSSQTRKEIKEEMDLKAGASEKKIRAEYMRESFLASLPSVTRPRSRSLERFHHPSGTSGRKSASCRRPTILEQQELFMDIQAELREFTKSKRAKEMEQIRAQQHKISSVMHARPVPTLQPVKPVVEDKAPKYKKVTNTQDVETPSLPNKPVKWKTLMVRHTKKSAQIQARSKEIKQAAHKEAEERRLAEERQAVKAEKILQASKKEAGKKSKSQKKPTEKRAKKAVDQSTKPFHSAKLTGQYNKSQPEKVAKSAKTVTEMKPRSVDAVKSRAPASSEPVPCPGKLNLHTDADKTKNKTVSTKTRRLSKPNKDLAQGKKASRKKVSEKPPKVTVPDKVSGEVSQVKHRRSSSLSLADKAISATFKRSASVGSIPLPILIQRTGLKTEYKALTMSKTQSTKSTRSQSYPRPLSATSKGSPRAQSSLRSPYATNKGSLRSESAPRPPSATNKGSPRSESAPRPSSATNKGSPRSESAPRPPSATSKGSPRSACVPPHPATNKESSRSEPALRPPSDSSKGSPRSESAPRSPSATSKGSPSSESAPRRLSATNKGPLRSKSFPRSPSVTSKGSSRAESVPRPPSATNKGSPRSESAPRPPSATSKASPRSEPVPPGSATSKESPRPESVPPPSATNKGSPRSEFAPQSPSATNKGSPRSQSAPRSPSATNKGSHKSQSAPRSPCATSKRSLRSKPASRPPSATNKGTPRSESVARPPSSTNKGSPRSEPAPRPSSATNKRSPRSKSASQPLYSANKDPSSPIATMESKRAKTSSGRKSSRKTSAESRKYRRACSEFGHYSDRPRPGSGYKFNVFPYSASSKSSPRADSVTPNGLTNPSSATKKKCPRPPSPAGTESSPPLSATSMISPRPPTGISSSSQKANSVKRNDSPRPPSATSKRLSKPGTPPSKGSGDVGSPILTEKEANTSINASALRRRSVRSGSDIRDHPDSATSTRSSPNLAIPPRVIAAQSLTRQSTAPATGFLRLASMYGKDHPPRPGSTQGITSPGPNAFSTLRAGTRPATASSKLSARDCSSSGLHDAPIGYPRSVAAVDLPLRPSSCPSSRRSVTCQAHTNGLSPRAYTPCPASTSRSASYQMGF